MITTTRAIHLLVLGLTMSACDGRANQAPQTRVDKGIEALPHLNQSGKRFPYLRYADQQPNSGNGRIFFLYPMMSERNQLLSLDSGPNVKVEELFAEDMAGISGFVSKTGNIIRIEFLPISLPLGVHKDQEWPLRYAERDFRRRSRSTNSSQQSPDRIAVSCEDERYTLSFVFDRHRGVEEFQDFCGSSICTFKLVDEEGLLSTDVLAHMGLPAI